MNLTIELRDEVGQALAAKAQERGVTAEEYVRQVVEEQVAAEVPVPAAPVKELKMSDEPLRHVTDMIIELWKDVPPEAWEDMPKDWATQLDHYVYGTPKREE